MLAALLLSSDAMAVIPLAIVAVVVAYVVSAQLPVGPRSASEPSAAPAGRSSSTADDARRDAVR
jgi:hypothetical protein